MPVDNVELGTPRSELRIYTPILDNSVQRLVFDGPSYSQLPELLTWGIEPGPSGRSGGKSSIQPGPVAAG